MEEDGSAKNANLTRGRIRLSDASLHGLNNATWLQTSSEDPRGRGEDELQVRLERERLHKGLLTNIPVYFSHEVARRLGYPGSKPDGVWNAYEVSYYLDGPYHLRTKVMNRDERLREGLRDMDWIVLEWLYDPPLPPAPALSPLELEEMVGEIWEALWSRGYELRIT